MLFMATLRVVISGDSMWPSYRSGDEVEFNSVDGVELQIGDLVVATHPLKSGVKVVKRIGDIDSHGRYILIGDNPDPIASEDSHNFGPVSRGAIIAYFREDSAQI